MVFVLKSISKLAWDWWAGSAQFGGYFSLPTEDSMAYTDLLFDICQQFGIHYYTATKKNAKKKTMPTALWHNIHAIYNEDVAAIDFMTGDVIEGQLPPKALAMVRE